MSVRCEATPPQALGPWPEGTACWRRPHGSDVPHVAPVEADLDKTGETFRDLIWTDQAYVGADCVVTLPWR